MDLSQAMEYINSLAKFGIVLGLDNMRALLDALGHPEKGLKIIHIAGTNGKGSTGAFIDAMLRASGFCVGRYVSPTVFCYAERFQIDGKNADEAELVRCIALVKEAAEKADITPTVFEVETAAGLCMFANCDYVLLEVGMGGRLDATNAVQDTLCSVITPIALDHTAILGDTIEKIAFEKAGIIKQNGTVITAVQQPQAMAVLEKTAAEKNAKLIKAGTPCINTDGSFDYNGHKGLEISLKGDYQYQNAALAVTVFETLIGSTPAIASGLKNAVWPGRFQIEDGDPLFIFDGAHNPHGVTALMQGLEKYGKCVYICGVFADKNYPEMVKTAAKNCEYVFAVTPPSPRALPADQLKDEFLKYTPNAETAALDRAIDRALEMRGKTIAVFGSLSFLGDAIRLYRSKRH